MDVTRTATAQPPRHRRLRLALALLLAAVALAPPAWAEQPETPLDRARRLHGEGRLEEALAAYRRVDDADPAAGAVAHNNACVLLIDLGRHSEALAECERALELRRASASASRATGEPADERGLGRTLNNLGLALQHLGRYRESRQRFGEALAINRRRDDAEGQAINLSNLAVSATYEGDYSGALAELGRVAALIDRHSDAAWAAEQRTVERINRGVVLEKLGAYREALAIYRGLLAGGEAGGDAGADRLDPGRRAVLETDTGVIYRNLGDPVRALAAFERSIDVYRGLGDVSGLSNAHLNRALALHLDLGRPRAAEADYRRALELARRASDRSQQIQDLFYLGRWLLDRGRVAEAETAFTECLEAARAAGSAEGLWSAHEGLGRVAEAGGDLHGALDHFEPAMTEIERVRAGLAAGEQRRGYFGDKRSVYGAAVRVLAALERAEPGGGHAEGAFRVAQRAKARELLDALGPESRPAPPLAAEQVRRRLGGAVLLDYFAGERDLYLWALDEAGLELVDLGPAVPILRAVRRLHDALAEGGPPPQAEVAALSAALLGPVAGRLPAAGGLIVAADGGLEYLPFELLDHPAGGAVVDRLEPSYLPSGSALGARRGGGGPRPALTLAGFGDPVLPAPREGSPAELLVSRFGLGPLPAAAAELAAVSRRLPGPSRVLLGARATEDAFRAAATRARVIHLVTHSVVDERPGRGAAVLLTAAGDDDGLLQPAEIAGLRLDARLTVIAACRTALAPAGGEGGGALTSLTGAFLAAGSDAVVATLWDVGDAATAVFMDQLYARLGRGVPPARALAETKRALRADPRWNRASLWSGYVLVGRADGPVAGWRPPGWLWAAAALALGLALALAAARLLIRTRSSRRTA